MMKLKWEYFFGVMNCRFYCCYLGTQRLEMRSTPRGREYCIGNFDEAKKYYSTETELLKVLKYI